MDVTAPDREMALVAFMQAQNCSNYPGSWRHAGSADDYLSPRYYQRIARVLEEGKFHMAFFDDRLAMPDTYGDDYRETVKHGIRAVKLDLPSILSVMGVATQRLGLGATYSTTYYEPFHVARVFGTLDHLTAGRAAWNIVTSFNDSEAANFGQEQHLEHDLRYDRADEFVEVVVGHWNSWDADAVIADRAGRVFADPGKVRRLDHRGKWFRSRGPFTIPPSPQQHPVLMQAGQSGRGRAFAAKWAELVFAFYPNQKVGKKLYDEFKSEIAATGRDPSTVKVAPAFYAIVGETRALAEEKRAYIDQLKHPSDALVLLSEIFNFDLATKPLDEAFSDAELESINGIKASRDRVTRLGGNPNPTVSDFVKHSGRGTIDEIPVFCGTGKDVADQMEAWFRDGCCDGFVLAATHMPGAYEDFVRLVVPELQRRGLAQREYKGTTLRENLGLPPPRFGCA